MIKNELFQCEQLVGEMQDSSSRREAIDVLDQAERNKYEIGKEVNTLTQTNINDIIFAIESQAIKECKGLMKHYIQSKYEMMCHEYTSLWLIKHESMKLLLIADQTACQVCKVVPHNDVFVASYACEEET
jgi:hypothetical protein